LHKPYLISALILLLFVFFRTCDVHAGSLDTDSDCPGRVCTLSESSLFVPITVAWQPDTNNLGFVDVFLEWRVSETDPEWVIEGADRPSSPFNFETFNVSATGFRSSAPRTASFTIYYSSQLRPREDQQGINCASSGLCTDFFGSVKYTVQVEALEALLVSAGTGRPGDGVRLSISYNAKALGGSGYLSGGRVHSPSGSPDLFFRANSTPEFPGVLSTRVEWSPEVSFPTPEGWVPRPHEGAVDGSDNWMKVIRDSDGAVSWSQFLFDFSAGDASDPILLVIPIYVSFADGRDFPLSVAVAASDIPRVTFGTGNPGNGVSLKIGSNSKQNGSYGHLQGGKVHSPSGSPDLFFRAGSIPEFPGALDTRVDWSVYGKEILPGLWTPGDFEGSVDGTDNWMKVIRDSDGAVSWTQFEIDLSTGAATEPTLRAIPLYVAFPDGRDFPLSIAVEAVALTPRPDLMFEDGFETGHAGLGSE